MAKRKFINAKQYCAHLTKPPRENTRYKSCAVEDYYICGFTERPCTAKEIVDATDYMDIFDYDSIKINKEWLSQCPAHNVSEKVAMAIKEDKIKRQISKLEEQLTLKNNLINEIYFVERI